MEGVFLKIDPWLSSSVNHPVNAYLKVKRLKNKKRLNPSQEVTYANTWRKTNSKESEPTVIKVNLMYMPPQAFWLVAGHQWASLSETFALNVCRWSECE